MMKRTTLLLLLLAGALSIALFNVKYRVVELEEELRRTNRVIVEHRESLHVLDAEWSFLNDPARLRKLAAEHLELEPAGPASLASFADLPAPDIDDHGGPGLMADGTPPPGGTATLAAIAEGRP